MKTEQEIRAFRDDLLVCVKACESRSPINICEKCFAKKLIAEILTWVLQGDSAVDRVIERVTEQARM